MLLILKKLTFLRSFLRMFLRTIPALYVGIYVRSSGLKKKVVNEQNDINILRKKTTLTKDCRMARP